MSKVTISALQDKKNANSPITALTAYDYLSAKYLDTAGIDIILIGDSLGNVFQGQDTTIPVTIDEMIYHTKAVKRGVKNAMVLTDMPFLSYQISIEDARRNAGRLVKESGAEALKIEVNPNQLDILKGIIDIGIPIMAHIGFTPQSVHQLGGYKVQGKSEKDAKILISLAKECEKMGAFSVLMEMVPAKVSKKITRSLSIPTIGIGAGPDCDGQILVTQDILGYQSHVKPKFIKQYLNLHESIQTAVSQYKSDVETKQFPTQEHSF